jgi:uncharacterized protein (TIGR02145 family)
MKKLLFFIVLLLLNNSLLFSQVSINADGSKPDNSAMLDVKSSDRGLLMPRLSTIERDRIVAPATGLLIYNTTSNQFNFYNGTAWYQLLSILQESPAIYTTNALNIAETTASSGGNVTSDGGEVVIARGVCWSTTENPTITDSKTTDGTGIGSFSSDIAGLTANTTYYVRAYATNSVGTAYGNQVSFKTATASGSGIVTDIDGNVYHTVTIGTQVWMVENLKTTKYNDGTSIPNITDNEAWAGLTTHGYCWYNNDAVYKNTYGALYNWYSVNTGKLAPTGWHVPSDAEWIILANYLDGVTIAGSKLKEMGTLHWHTPNTDATNGSGFTALPGGDRSMAFAGMGDVGHWWSRTYYDETHAWYIGLDYRFAILERLRYPKQMGFSVRCLRD